MGVFERVPVLLRSRKLTFGTGLDRLDVPAWSLDGQLARNDTETIVFFLLVKTDRDLDRPNASDFRNGMQNMIAAMDIVRERIMGEK